MENRNYVVDRDQIYVGEVVRTDCIYRYEGDTNFLNTKPGQLDTGAWRSFRTILFVPTENNFANDLLYRSPNYPVLNVTDDDTCLSLGTGSIVVKDAINLSLLLQFFCYQKNLRYEDIMKIRKTFFTGNFAKDNCELFGYRETMAEDVTFFKNGVEITNPRELERRRRKFRQEQKAGHRMFSGVFESPLPTEYWDVLDDRGDNSFRDLLEGWNDKMNAFAPDKLEGPIKKLSRF